MIVFTQRISKVAILFTILELTKMAVALVLIYLIFWTIHNVLTLNFLLTVQNHCLLR